MKKVVNVLFIFILLAPAALAADTSSEITAEKLFADKKAAIKEFIPLSEQESRFFWPLYDEYEKKELAIFKRRAAHMKEYLQNHKNMSDEKAEWMMTDFLQIETDSLELKRKLVERFSEKLPAKTVFRFFVFQQLLEAGFVSKVAEELPEIE